jgi:predicted metal-binding protein
MTAHIGPSVSSALLVCITCKSEGGPVGPGLFEALGERLGSEPGIALKAVECLSVCKRPCTVALAAPGKWTYVVGDLDRGLHLEDIIVGARRYAASLDGIVPWRERPLCFRKGVVSRTPPLAMAQTASA